MLLVDRWISFLVFVKHLKHPRIPYTDDTGAHTTNFETMLNQATVFYVLNQDNPSSSSALPYLHKLAVNALHCKLRPKVESKFRN